MKSALFLEMSDPAEFTTQYGEVVPFLPRTEPSAGLARRLAKRVLKRLNEFKDGHGLRWLKVGRVVYESTCLMGVEDGRRFPDTTHGLFLCGLPVVLGHDLEPNVVCYYG